MPDTPQTLKGFRDFLPTEKRQRDFVESKMRTVFERHGFAPLETPTLEYASLLLGKYGTEADKLVYTFEDRGERKVGLRYDQTVPTARVLAQLQHQLPKYFRRYQIQNVFRADKPQKGRYREFRQCDCDIFASTSPLADAEILAVYYNVFKEIGITSLKIQLNDRQTLMDTLSPFATPEVNVFSIIQSIDKSDKNTPEEIHNELVSKGLLAEAANAIFGKLENVEPSENLQKIVHYALKLGIPQESLIINPKLARGLDYYTGMIFEGIIPEYGVGSVGGGGRYDKLIGDLSGVQIPAVGFGIGFDRTVEAAVALGLVPTGNERKTILVTVFNEGLAEASAAAAAQLRRKNIPTELYPTATDNLGKQLKYASQNGFWGVIIIGDEEHASGTVTFKELASGEQKKILLSELNI